jgi:hypothetical protein
MENVPSVGMGVQGAPIGMKVPVVSGEEVEGTVE